MRTLDIDFVPESSWKGRLRLAILLLSAAYFVGTAWRAGSMWRDLQAAQAKFLTAKNEADRLEARQQQLNAIRLKPRPWARDAEEIVRLARFPTGEALHALEGTQIEGVRTRTIELNPSTATARVELEFGDAGALMTYLEQINAGEPQPRWTLVQAKMPQAGIQGSAILHSVWKSAPSE